jgi:uncharacterized membrane protein YdfJ with MMPL/SSD domain
MSPLRKSQNLAARMGRWSARHRKIAIFGWLAFVVAALALGHAIGTKQLSSSDGGSGDTGKAQHILNANGFQSRAGESVLVQSKTLTVHDAAFTSAVQAVVGTVSRQPVVTNLRSPLDHPGQVAKDGHSVLVQFEIKGDSDKATNKIGPVLAAVAGVQKANPSFTIEELGDASVNKALNDTIGKDFRHAELLSIPITLVILIVAFGALVAAGIPLLLGLSAVAAALGLLAIPSHIWPADSAAQSVILLIGLAVGVDYSLFYLKREREERANGLGAEAALEAAAATSGRSVLISGMTVLIAMAGMFFTGDKVFTSIAIGTILVVAIAVLGSLTVLPAVLSKLGDRVEKGRVPFLHRLRGNGEGRFWSAIVDRVLRRPALSAVLAGGVLVALTIPAFGIHTALPGFNSMPKSLAIVKTYDRVQKAFPGGPTPAQVVVEAPNVDAPAVRHAIANLERAALASGEAKNPISVEVNAARTVEVVSVPIIGKGTDSVSNHALDTLRKHVIPTTIGTVAGTQTYVTGQTAGSKDFNDQMKSRAPIVFGFVLVLAFLLLLSAFRSLVVAAKAIVLNLLSVGAAYGLLVLVFQHGIGRQLIGQQQTTGIIAWLPLFLFVVLFGLSMDYHVFILSRVREAVDRGATTEDAVRHGIGTTAGVVTSAAMVMVAVFAIFATLSTVDMKQLGFGLASAILIDATLVRAVLLPSLMKLLGEWNWYMPRWLDWVPKLAVDEDHELRPALAEAA